VQLFIRIHAGCDLKEVYDMFRKRDCSDAFLQGAQEPVYSYYELSLSNVWDITFSKLDSTTLDFLNIVIFLNLDAIAEQLFDVDVVYAWQIRDYPSYVKGLCRCD
jgi:hypothetical protein